MTRGRHVVVGLDSARERAAVEIANARKLRLQMAPTADELVDWAGRPDVAVVILSDPFDGMPAKTIHEAIAKTRPDLPIVWIGVHDRPTDLDHAEQSGAAQYFPRPIDPEQLLARLKVHVRDETLDPGTIVSGNHVVLNKALFTVHVCGLPLVATVAEFSLLRYLYERLGRVIDYRELEEKVLEGRGDGAKVRVHVHNLRRKVRALGLEHELIGTVRSRGYFAPAVPVEGAGTAGPAMVRVASRVVGSRDRRTRSSSRRMEKPFR